MITLAIPLVLSADGSTALISAHGDDDNGTNSGSAYIFQLENGTWVQKQKLTASDGADSDYFGRAVTLSSDGGTAVISAHGDDDKGSGSGSAYVFQLENGYLGRTNRS